MKAISELDNAEIVAWIKALDDVYDTFGTIPTEDTTLYNDLITEIFGRGFDHKGNPYRTLYSDRVALGKAWDELFKSIANIPILVGIIKWGERVAMWMHKGSDNPPSEGK